VPASMTLHRAAAFLSSPETRHPSFPVVDEEKHVLGIVDPPSVIAWRHAGRHRSSSLGELLAGSKVTLAYPDEYLEVLAEKLMKANVAHLPVVSRDEERLVGYVGWKDLMRVRLKLRAEERDRSSFIEGAFRKKAKAETKA